MNEKQIIKIQHDGRVFIDMPDDDANVCKSCGACCNYFRISFYFGEIDTMKQGFVPDEKAEKLNSFFACMKGTNNKPTQNRCIALKGEIGKDVSCSIYHNRPSPCREFAVFDDNGAMNPRCIKARQAHGLM